MKPTRILASATLLFSSIALITAAGITVGDEPGVVRMGAYQPPADDLTAPAPDPVSSGGSFPGGSFPGGPPDPNAGLYPEPAPYAPYFERSYGATQQLPDSSFQPKQPFGPIMMFETNIGDGLGYGQPYQRLNARVPYHIVPNTNVLIGDISASVTNYGNPIGNAGLIYRNYDAARDRIFGWNGYFDYDQGYTKQDWYRAGVGLESLGKYLDFRANGYFVAGDDTALLSTELQGGLLLGGNNVFRLRNNVRENAYSGADAEVGGPLPVLGQYGINMYAGAYYLGNDYGNDTVGFMARWQALVTQNLTVNTYLTSDDTFGTNSWVGLQYQIPNYRDKRFLRPASVRERLQDPVYRQNRIQTHIDQDISREACINSATGLAYNLIYVDPNSTTAGTGLGTYEDPYTTMQFAAAANSAAVDVIRVTPREDNTGTNLTINGGLTLFDDQALISSNSDYELFRVDTTPFYIPGTGLTGPGPLLTRPNMLAGESVVRLANNDTISGMRFDGANAAGAVFGNGVSNPLPITGVNLTNNTFTNYVVGANLQDVSGRMIIQGNTFTGRPVTANIRSTYGLRATVAGASTANLLLTNNTATTNQIAGLSVTANAGSTVNADLLNGPVIPPPIPVGKYAYDAGVTGITNNILTGNGNGIEVLGNAGSTINAAIENNQISSSTSNGLLAGTDAGTFNLYSLRNNVITGNYNANVAPTTSENGAFLYYKNGGTFFALSEDVNEDKNFNGVLDPGEDLNGNGVLNVANGTLDAGEDLNGNGILDQGIVSNTFQNNVGVGLCIFGETAGTGSFMIGGPETSLGNRATNNGNAGMALDLNGTATASVDSMFNTITDNAFARTYTTQVQASFAMTGDTFGAAATLTNNSSTGDILAFNWDLNLPGGTQDWEFQTASVLNPITFPNAGPGKPFTPLNGSDLTTGLNAVNGFGVPPYTNALQTALDGSQQLALGFTNDPTPGPGFNPTDVMAWQLDSDPNKVFPDAGLFGDTAVTANQLAGTTGSVTFRDDFTGNGVQSTRTLAGNFVQDPADANGLVLDLNQSFSAPIFDTGRKGDGFRVHAVDNTHITHFNSTNDTMSRNGGTGLSIVAANNATVDALTIQGGTFEQNAGRGINLEARDNAVIHANSTLGGFDPLTLGQNIILGTSYTEGNVISRNSSDGIRVLAANGGRVDGNLINNNISENLGDGAALIIDNGGTLNFGSAANKEVISRNTINGNVGAGLRLTSNVTPVSMGTLNALVQGNTISANAGGGIVSQLTGLHSFPPINNSLNLTVNDASYLDLTAAQNRNYITGNSDVGIGVNVGGNGLANVVLNNVSVTGTLDGVDPLRNGDGIALTRADASLLTAQLDNVTSTLNAGDGLDVDAQGNDRFDPNQPSSGTPNTVTVNNSAFNANGGNGAQFRVRGDAVLIGDVTGSSFNNNGQNGMLVQTSQNSSFGDPTIGLPPGRRSIFDGNTFNNNAVDGVQLVGNDQSRVLVEITSTRVPVPSAAHADANTAGDTTISNNGRDGVHIDTNGGRSDILITSATGQTTIDGNGTAKAADGTAIGGNGVRLNSSGTSDGVVRVSRTIIKNSIAGPSEDTNGDGILDPAEDLNANDDIDVADGDGIQANFSGNATATLIVGGVNEGNIIQKNQDDGIALTATGSTGTGTPRPVIAITGNTIGGTNDGVNMGNGGDGVSLNVFGGTAVGIAPANIAANGTSPTGGVTQSGPIPQLTMTDNLVSQNGRRGVNLLLTGAAGIRARENGASLFDPVRITLDNNRIVSNGMEGVFYRGDANMNQSRFVYLPNFPFPDPPFTPADDRPQFPAFYDPLLPQFTSLNFGSVNGNTAYIDPYLNLRTVQNSFLTVTNNKIQNNGTGRATGEGLFINVGTGSYLAADVQNNAFGGNLEEDFRTVSFLSAGETFTSVDNAGVNTYDAIYLDDTAQFDLRFQNNEGNQILPSSRGDDLTPLGATYTTLDPLKAIFMGTFGASNRQADFFQVDNGPSLNNPNNTFINFGITQDIQNAFNTGGYNLRAAADPMFPNIGFAPFLP